MMKRRGVFLGFTGVIVITFLIQSLLSFSSSSGREDINEKGPDFLRSGEYWADSILKTMTLRDKVAQFFMVAAWSSGEKQNRQEIEQWIKNQHIGGIIFFQGDTQKQKELTEHYQSISKVPLLIGMDAEWGPAMRLSDAERYPYQLTLGATNNDTLVHDAGYWIGRECADLGVHINFAPVADVNVNPGNPVISYRSFGENPREVAENVLNFSEGMEKGGVMACVKHFPGHGDTETDSHYELPTVNHTVKQFQAIDFVPFQRAINGGVAAVMIAHLNVPALDSTGIPSSLSEKVIKGWLRDSLKFDGLVISDALNMKGVADRFGKEEVVLRAFLAGNDILLFPESVNAAIDAILVAVEDNKITESEIDDRCKKVLKAKYWALQQQKKRTVITTKDLLKVEYLKRAVAKSAVTVVRNEDSCIPILDFTKKTGIVVVGKKEDVAENRLLDYLDAKVFYFSDYSPERMGEVLFEYDRVIHVYIASTNRPAAGFGLPEGWDIYQHGLNPDREHIGIFIGNPYAITKKDAFDIFDGLVVTYENSPIIQDIAIQGIMGAIGLKGRLPVTIDQRFRRETSFHTEGGKRMSFILPEEAGIDRVDLSKIDSIALAGMDQGAYPGCQIIVALEGKVIYRKNFGYYTYSEKNEVSDRTVYDLASITKVAATTLTLMDLKGKGLFDLDATLGDYLPDIVGETVYANLKMQDMLTHQAGLTPWIPFYTKTLKGGNWKQEIYSTTPKEGYSTQVAEGLYILDNYQDSIFARILETPLRRNQGYRYSDVGYYFLKEIIRRKTGVTIDQYVRDHFYIPMGMSAMTYHPLRKMDGKIITPTENDKIFRKQLIRGYVHDQGAAMQGGVGGHAGLFSNAMDVTKLMQMFLDSGRFAGKQLLEPQVINEFTSCPNCSTNRRGIGFDKPVRSLSGGPTSELVSLDSYGHTGFTGTMAWADPKYGVNYVFLSNRVYPDAENKKLLSLSTRTEIQRVIYEALKKKKNYIFTNEQ